MKRLAPALLLLWTTGAALALPAQWKAADGGNNHWYEVVATANPMGWFAARDAAAARGGYLATTTSAAENTFVYGLIRDARYWQPSRRVAGRRIGPRLGAFQVKNAPEPAGGWTWITGEAWASTNWLGGEPDNSGGDERVAHYVSASANLFASKWADGTTGTEDNYQSYIIEWDQHGNWPPGPPTGVTVKPAYPGPDQDLRAQATGAVDPEGQPLTYRYQWWKSTDNGATWTQGPGGATLPKTQTAVGDRWKALAKASDGALVGPAVYSPAVQVLRPFIAATAPANSATGVRRWSPVTVTFAWPMNQASAQSHFEITGPGGAAIPGTFDWPTANTKLRFTPTGFYAAGAVITVRLLPAVQRRDGVVLGWGESFRFTTGTHPVVVDWGPTGSNVATTTPFTIAFDQPMDPDTVADKAEIVPFLRGSLAWNAAKTDYTYTVGRLAAGQTYRVTMHAGATSAAGEMMGLAFTWSFTTASSAGLALNALAAAAPGGGAQVTVSLSAPATVRVTVTNLAGREVAALPPRDLPPGTSQWLWNGRTAAGVRVPSGQYLLRVQAAQPGGATAQRLLPLRY